VTGIGSAHQTKNRPPGGSSLFGGGDVEPATTRIERALFFPGRLEMRGRTDPPVPQCV
jgi:hypothetical protein